MNIFSFINPTLAMLLFYSCYAWGGNVGARWNCYLTFQGKSKKKFNSINIFSFVNVYDFLFWCHFLWFEYVIFLSALNMQKYFLIVSNFEHVTFAINEKVPKTFMTIQIIMLSLWFFQTYKNLVLSSVHPLGWLFWLWFYP